MKKLYLLLALGGFLYADYIMLTPYQAFCKENPTAAACNYVAIGGTDTLSKERKREIKDDYHYSNDGRLYPSHDLEDPRESL